MGVGFPGRAEFILLLLVALGTTVFAQDQIILRSAKTGRRYGPFPVAHGQKVLLGASEFTIEMESSIVNTNSEPVEAKSESEPGKPTLVEQEAFRIANEWLSLIDGGQLEQAWDTMASFAKSSVTKDDFVNAVKQVHESLGTVDVRRISRMDHASSLPAAPDGHYIVITFQSRMTKKMSATEVIVPMLDDDGHWRISGYRVQ